MSDAIPVTYYWDASTPTEIAGALEVFSAKYPVLNAKNGKGIKLTFVKGKDPATCSLKAEKNEYIITYGKMNMALRMLGGIISNAIPSKDDYCPFDMFGVMIDCSRNSVMTVDYMKSYFDRLAILGYNMVMLYTEDTYLMEKYPFFGLQRGAYTAAEIKELDDYAAKLGMEMIPCIQTLAHLEQMFRWPAFGELNDIYGILLVDEPKVYELIEEMLITWKKNVRSRRIHLGMDEAHGVGSGRFKQLHGEESQFDIINRHLGKVVELCRKHGLEPMIWSDMYFRIGSKTHDYYDKDCVIPDEVAQQIPKEVELVYWDYYHDQKDFYSDWIARHRKLGGEPVMGSGIWTWNKFWYDHIYTTRTVDPCVAACREAKVKDVFFTMWGDDGGFCDYDSTFAGLAYAAELAFTGKVSDRVIGAKFNKLFDGASYSDVRALADIAYVNIPPIIWDDPLMLMYNGSMMKHETLVYDQKFDFASVKADFTAAAVKLAKARKRGSAGDLKLAKALVDAVVAKLNYADCLINSYAEGKYQAAAAAAIPLAKDYLKKFRLFVAAFRNMWMSHNKTFGFETMQIRFAGQEARINEAILRLTEVAEGKAKRIPELDDMLKGREEFNAVWTGYNRLAHGTTIC